MRKFIGGIAIGLVTGVIIAVKAPTPSLIDQQSPVMQIQSANNKKSSPVVWDLVSMFPNKLMFDGSLGLALNTRLKEISNDNIELKFYEPGSLVPIFDLFDAVSAGTVDTALSSSQYWGGKSPAFELFNSVPFGPNIPAYLTWFRQHGGQIFYEQLYRKYNIHSMLCGITGVAGAGWFKNPINELADFKNLKIAATGLASRVYEHIGATTVLVAPSDLRNAFKKEEVDAVSFSTPATDKYLNITEFAHYYYFPGWFQQAGFIDLMINLNKWEALNHNQQKIIETVCMANIEYSLSAIEGRQFNALKHFIKKGTDVKRFSPEIIRALNLAWISISNTLATSDKNFGRVWKSLQKFRENYSIWQELGKFKLGDL
jgi:TRAP-type mannitol/chloroaromatic compound transport system substrate-binding protein